MAPRPRSSKNKDLPANLYRNDDGKSFRYRHPIDGTWHGMGTDKTKAIAAANKLNSLLIKTNDLVGAVLGKKTFGDIVKYYLEEDLPTRAKKYSAKTIDLYTLRLTQCNINSKWENLPIDSITLLMVNEHLDTLTNRASNQCRSRLIEIFSIAMSKGLCPDNPAAATLKKPEKKQRKRHTLEGLTEIRAVAPTWLQNAIDLALLTTQRRSDIIKMKWADIKDGWLYIEQVKTTEDSDDEFEELEGAGYIRLKIDEEIQKVLDRCKASDIISPFIIHRRPLKINNKHKATKEHWTQINLAYLSVEFKKAADLANPYPTYTAQQKPTFHEVRALSIHLYKQLGKDPQALAGHASAQMTDMYASGHSTILWNDVEVGMKLPFNTD